MTCPVRGKRITAFAAVVLAALAVEARAARLPLRTYTTADGLARNTVLHILQDSRGLLWIATTGGLSRFDGFSLVDYPRDLGLPSAHVNVTFESRSGDLYVGTDRGLCRIHPGTLAGDRCLDVPPPAGRRVSVNAILEDTEGSIWIGAAPGLYRLDPRREPPGMTRVEVPFGSRPWGADSIESLVLDRHGNLWMGSPSGGVYRRRPDGSVRRTTIRQGLPSDTVRSLLEDSRGRIWVGTDGGLARLSAREAPGGGAVERVYGKRDGLPGAGVTALLEGRDGSLWVGTAHGVARGVPSPGGEFEFHPLGESAGLGDLYIRAIREGREGNIWLGTAADGLIRLRRDGPVTYDAADGLPEGKILQIGETREKALFVVTGEGIAVSRGDGRFRHSQLPAAWGVGQSDSGRPLLLAEDPGGGWWVGSPRGLRRYGPLLSPSDLGRAAPRRVYTERDGLPGRRISMLQFDSGGNLWVGTSGDSRGGLARWDRATGRFHPFTNREGYPREDPTPVAMVEEPAGQVWVALHPGGVARVLDGRIDLLSEEDGLPGGPITALHRDRLGRLWIATARAGVARLDSPGAGRPRFSRLPAAEGLAGDHILSIGEDLRGMIYLGRIRGVDRLDPETGRHYHFDPTDGLIDSEVQVMFRDHRGVLWLGTDRGINRMDPVPDRVPPPPTVLITAYSVPGGPSWTSLVGSENSGGPILRPSQDDVTIEYVGVSPASADKLRYQTQLEGATGGWSPPTRRRSVTYSQLPPGHYRFQVRALDSVGLPVPRIASLQMEVLRPFWQRGWFLALVGLSLLSGITLFYRRRLARQLELERIRTRIATDLHDDLGATLSQVAFLSEVARWGETGDRARGTLERIGGLVGQAMDAMDDIVWSVDPTKDRVASLSSRLRHFAEEIVSGREIRLQVSLPPPGADGHLSDPGLRRHILLFAKECLTNAVRHSGASEMGLNLALDSGELTLRIQDNGRGIPQLPPGQGRGLVNLRRRTESLGGTLEVDSAPDRGTRVTLRVPLRPRRRGIPFLLNRPRKAEAGRGPGRVPS